jgi:hypothetical protein
MKKTMIFFLAAVTAVMAGCMSKPSDFFNPSAPSLVTHTPFVTPTVTGTATVTVTPCCGAIIGNVSAYDCDHPVTDATPGANARIKVFSGGVLKAFAIAGADGNYEIDTLTPGTYDLVVQLIRYGIDSTLTNINVAAGNMSAGNNLVKMREWKENTICFDDWNLLTPADIDFLFSMGLMMHIEMQAGNMTLVVDYIPVFETPDSVVEKFNATSPGTFAHKCVLSCP